MQGLASLVKKNQRNLVVNVRLYSNLNVLQPLHSNDSGCLNPRSYLAHSVLTSDCHHLKHALVPRSTCIYYKFGSMPHVPGFDKLCLSPGDVYG